jgi:hypothetical protein
MICEFQGWAQGGLGMVILAAGLLFAIGLMVYFRWTGAIPYVIGGALVMYYGVPVIEDMFHWDQDCAVVRAQFSQEEHYASNTRLCERNLFNTDAQTGEDCSCNGESATPDCESYYSACEGSLDGFVPAEGEPYCACEQGTQNASPICTNNQKMVQSSTVTGGNPITMTSTPNSLCETSPAASYSPGYDTCISGNPQDDNLSGCLNISGTAMVGHVCGTNSGICGTGNDLVAHSTGSSCGPNGTQGQAVDNHGYYNEYPVSTGDATGGPIAFENGTFQGPPIVVRWLSSTGQQMEETFTPNGNCVTESINGKLTGGEYCG